MKSAWPADDTNMAVLVELAQRYLQMPESLVGLFQVASNVAEMVPTLQEIGIGCTKVIDGLDKWQQQVSRISLDAEIREEDGISGVYGATADAAEGVKPPFQGIYGTHPVWCALWFCSGTLGNEARSTTYRKLQSYFLAAFILLQHEGRELQRSKRIDESGSLLRKIHQPDYGDELDKLMEEVASIEALYARLAELHHIGDARFRHGYGAFADLLNGAFELGYGSVFAPRQLGAGGRGNGAPRESSLRRLYSDHSMFWQLMQGVEEGRGWPSTEVEVRQRDDAPVEEAINHAIAPTEYTIDDLAWLEMSDLIGDDVEPRELPPLGTLYAAARARARHIVMESQRLITRLSRIRIDEIVEILSVLEKAYSDVLVALESAMTQQREKELELRKETILLAAVSLIGGAPPADVVNMHQVDALASLPERYRLSYAPKYRVWLIPYSPPKRNPLTAEARKSTGTTKPRIVLSDIWGVGSKLDNNRIGKYFKHHYSTYESVYEKIVEPVLKERGVRPQWRSLDASGRVLYTWFLGIEEGDNLRPAVLFGRKDRLAETQRYYTAFDRRQLQSYYDDRMRDLWDSVQKNGFVSSDNQLFSLQPSVKIGNTLTGDDRVPRIESLKDGISRLQDRLSTIPDQSDWAEQLRWHNDLTAYTAMVTALVTGLRSVRTPIPDLTAIDSETGFLNLHEKDTMDGSHARIVWLPPEVCKQIDNYRQHLSRFHRLTRGRVPVELKVKARKNQERLRYNSPSYTLDLRKTFFFVKPKKNNGGKAVEFRGKTLQEHLNASGENWWPVPNAGRHFLRTFLVERQCDDTLINTLLGHWGLGEASWGPYSTFDPLRFREHIRPHLEALLETIEFRLVATS